jgi:hypothetical protein
MKSKLVWAVGIGLLLIGLGCSKSSSTGPGSGPRINISDATVPRGHDAVFTVTLSATSSSPVIFNYATSAGTAVAGTDFVSKSGVDTIHAAGLSTTISVSTIRGTVATTEKTFTLTLSSATNGGLNDSIGVGTLEAFGGLVSFATDVRPILQASCASTGGGFNCHSVLPAGGSLYLGATFPYDTVHTAQGAHAALMKFIGPNLVSPIADSSSLYRMVDTSGLPPIPPYNLMPAGTQPLSGSDQQKIKDWIDQGAPNN